MFDRNIIDGLGVNGAGWLTRFISRVSMWWDTWIVDGSVRLARAHRLAAQLSGPHDARRRNATLHADDRGWLDRFHGLLLVIYVHGALD